ncbi:MAG: hypothetical protein H0X36_03400 [Sphingomonadaceae bacterium]|nr:hypothetical protein [Sphingomonadaceae bacterium]
MLASFFTLAIVLDPSDSGARVDPVLLLVSSYTLVSAAIFGLTWNNWWLEARIATPAHAVDLLVFAILVALTEGYSSPFFTFFVFLVLSSTIRGGWREALLTTGIVVVLYVAAAGLTAAGSPGSPGIEIQRFVIRGAHLVVLSFMIVWFGISQLSARRGRVGMQLDDAGIENDPPVRQALEHAARRLDAGRIVLAWSDTEEPWLHVDSIEHGVLRQDKFGPGEFPDLIEADFGGGAFLFDEPRRRLLFLRDGRRQTLADKTAIDPLFAARFGVDTGLAIPVKASSHEGHLFALSIPGLSSDDLWPAVAVGEEVSAAFEHGVLFAATRDAATARARLVLAHDLHDSVVQFLAGMGLKLESLKKALSESSLVTREIDELQHLLVEEQRDLRSLIGALKKPPHPASHATLQKALLGVASRLEQQWGITLDFSLDPSLGNVPAVLHHDIEQLIREAAANAVRHGHATCVSIEAGSSEGMLRLDIADDGSGFPVEGDFADSDLREARVGPRSLYDRVHMLGGEMRLKSSARTGSLVSITLPLKGNGP